MIPDLDAGPLIGQAVLDIQPDDTAQSLEQRVQHMEYWLYPTCLQLITSGAVQLGAASVNQTHTACHDYELNSAGVYTWTEDRILAQHTALNH